MNLMFVLSEFYYIRTSLVIWRINGLSRIKNVDSDSGHKLCELIDEASNESFPIIVDFKGVVTLTDGSMTAFFKKVIDLKKEIHFINCQPIKIMIRGLYDEFVTGSNINLSEFEDRIVMHDGENWMKTHTSDLTETIVIKIDEMVKNIVKNSFVPNDNEKKLFLPLSSTPILTTGQFDATSIISNPNHFTIICIRLADRVEQIIADNTLLNAQLLSVSFKASPFANAVSLLLNIQMRTIDHLGPFQKVWDLESFNRYGVPDTNYIFIGDFIVGGTEMKLAHLFAKYCDSDLKHAIAIGTLFDSSRFERYDVSALVSIKDINGDCEYKLFA